MDTIKLLDADILLVQESHFLMVSSIVEAKPTYAHVVDAFPGWGGEGQVLWDRSRWAEVDHGDAEVGLDPKERRLFWVRLRSLRSGRTVVAATAHLNWQGHSKECSSDINVRKAPARAIAKELSSLVQDGEPAFFGGDMNEGFWPRRILSAAGFGDCFHQLGQAVPITHPAYPCGCDLEDCLDPVALDWLTSNGWARVVAASALNDLPRHSEGKLQASDHFPVIATYELLESFTPIKDFRPDVVLPTPN
eukprot:GGOE01041304.1.p1 GENE.GGOE01041304.1~~GGOE01041304.1.p1  ORF type:complete len:288 (+),score=82.65 GGOE01041304.1:119-865(+)